MDRGSIWATGYGDWPCDKNNGSQQFYIKTFDDKTFQIMDTNKTSCLDTSEQRWNFKTCDANNQDQRFKWINNGDRRNIQQVNRGMHCLDIGNSDKHWSCGVNDNQNAFFSIV